MLHATSAPLSNMFSLNSRLSLSFPHDEGLDLTQHFPQHCSVTRKLHNQAGESGQKKPMKKDCGDFVLLLFEQGRRKEKHTKITVLVLDRLERTEKACSASYATTL